MPRTFYDTNMNNGKLIVMESNFAEVETVPDDIMKDL